jgi:hypothetical protein
VFTVDDFAVRLRDLGSTNGTIVNGERLQGQVVLKAGDHVSVGKLSFEIVVKQTAAKVAQPVAASAPDSSPNIPAAAAVEPEVNSSDTSLNVADTIEVPIAPAVDDTAIIDAYRPNDPAAQQAAMQQPAFLPSNPYPQPGYGMPPGYAMPGYMPGYPQGYPQVPGYPPGYGVPPGYMPPGYGMQPMMPGYGMPQQQPQAAPAPEAAGSASRTIEAPPVMLPNPEDTGARAPAPPPPPPPTADGQPAPAAAGKNPSDSAADIIRNHRTRRPG